MTISIHPQSLKFHRKRRGWTQQQLSDATPGQYPASVPTIKRIENVKEGTYAAINRVAEGLAKALGVSIETLSKTPSKDENPERDWDVLLGRRPFPRTMVNDQTMLAFRMVEILYGISRENQVRMAPLFAALLIEGSFVRRRKHAEALEDALKNLEALEDTHKGHRTFIAVAALRLGDGIGCERASLDKRDIFGEVVSDYSFDGGYDPSEHNPFADHLREMASEAEEKYITIDESLGSSELPDYQIGEKIIDRWIGSDREARYSFSRGHACLTDMPEDLRGGDKKDERIAWMIEQIPEEERAALQTQRDELQAFFGDSGSKENSASSEDSPEGEEDE